MKLILTLVMATCFILNGFAQRQQNVYFFKKSGKEVKQRDSADYIRIIREPDSGKVNYELVEYYRDNSIKRTGEVSAYKPSLKMEGQIVSYYTNGTKQSIYNYRNNKLVDTCIRFFSNGKPEEIRYYDPSSKDSLYRIVQIYYEDGKPILDETGSGYIKRNTSKYKTIEGTYKEGRKDGVWKEYDLKKKEELEEVFLNGIFQKGTSKDENGNTYAYTIKEKLPEFKGGITGFYKFLSNKLTYPTEARSRGIQGRVVISFMIDEAGHLGEFKVLKSVSSDLDTEALRVMALSPKWQPGIQNGKPVKVLYSVPIAFSLAKKN